VDLVCIALYYLLFLSDVTADRVIKNTEARDDDEEEEDDDISSSSHRPTLLPTTTLRRTYMSFVVCCFEVLFLLRTACSCSSCFFASLCSLYTVVSVSLYSKRQKNNLWYRFSF